MSKVVSKALVAGLLITWLLAAGIGSFQAEASTAGNKPTLPSSDIQKQAQYWVDELSAKQGYAAWKGTSIAISPLGPGTHGWLALVQNSSNEPVGYLVIHAREEGGYQLGEYGTGPYPLFNETSLQFSLLQLELINKPNHAERVYSGPLQAAWRITSDSNIHYADAVTGEQLPVIKDDEWKKRSGEPVRLVGLTDARSKVKTSKLIPSFNPYARLPWLTKSPITITDQKYAALLKLIGEMKEIRYTVESFEGKLLQVWSIVGYDTWEGGQIYLALGNDEENDRRYIPMELLAKQGQFYR